MTSKITDDDVKRAFAMLSLEGEGTLLSAAETDAPDLSAALVKVLRDLLERHAVTEAMRPAELPRLASVDTWEPYPDGWTAINKTNLRLGGRLDAKTTAQVLPGVSYLPSTFSGEFFGNDLQQEILRGDVLLFAPKGKVPKAALKLAPAVWAQRLQMCSTAAHARECATHLKGTQYSLNAESKATQLEANEARRAKAAAAPQTGAVNSFTAGKNPLTAPAEPLPPGAVRNSFGVIQQKA